MNKKVVQNLVKKPAQFLWKACEKVCVKFLFNVRFWYFWWKKRRMLKSCAMFYSRFSTRKRPLFRPSFTHYPQTLLLLQLNN